MDKINTIYAQSSAIGKAGVSVFRLSGINSLDAASRLTDISDIQPRMLYLKELKTNEGETIDNAMLVYFRGPHSFTGEDVVEIHTHGSIAVAKILTDSLLATELLRLAEPGEFARRAFMNGKMDLTSAEGIADLIDAETKIQHRQAMRQMGGELERLYSSWRQQLLQCISRLEAYIDFPDEEIPAHLLSLTQNSINELKATLHNHLDDKRRGERLRNGLELTILGAPNVGKSSLLNFLAQREVAIVSGIAGTTRDVIETHLDIGGYPIILKDTAGLRKGTSDEIEIEGIKRAMESAKYADIKIVMLDATSEEPPSPELMELIDENTIVVMNKVDLTGNTKASHGRIALSLKHKINLDKLLEAIEALAAKIARPQELPSITRTRHRHHVKQALAALNQCDIGSDLVLATEDIRMAIRYLSILTGKIEVEEILGEIFANFCIGK